LKHLDAPGLEIEQVFREVRKTVMILTDNKQVPWSHSSLTEPFYFSRPADMHSNDTKAKVADAIMIDATLGNLLRDQEVKVRNQKLSFASREPLTIDAAVTKQGVLRNGLNTLFAGGRSIRAWYEERQLIAFEEPYKKSFAVIAAVDDYGENVTCH
jgi:hypothetical protein